MCRTKQFVAAVLLALAAVPLGGQETIVLHPRVLPAVEKAVGELADTIEAKTGHRPTIRHSRLLEPKEAIYIGNPQAARRAMPLPKALSHFGSVSRHGRDGRVYLRARNSEALIQGIYRLAYNEYGARRFVPKEGVSLLTVDKSHKEVSSMPALEEPAFEQRHLGTGPKEFYRWNNLNQPYQFNHALAQIFDGDLYASNPELFARRGDGKPFVPKGSRKYDAQPHLALPKAADHAARAALAYFEANPEARSFSLAINDNIRFDESAATRALVEPITYFRGLPNYTDLVFTFMNRVAERVFDEGGAWETPGGEPRYLTALAYYWAEAAPSFPLHPRVMPVLTSDRAQWQDPAFREEDKALIEAWSRSGAERIGTWDYYYGAPYPYPRQFNHWIIESIRHLAANGVDVFYTAMPYMLAYDGPKAYLTAQLLWDPWQDAEMLLGEFYQGVFGPAAERMRGFYEAFELKHNEQGGEAAWIKFYMDEAGIEKFSVEFLESMQRELEAAHGASEGHPEIQRRIEDIQRDFAITRIYRALQAARRVVVTGLKTTPDATLAEAIQNFTATREELKAQLEPLFAIERYAYNFRLLKDGAQSDPIPAALGALARAGVDVEVEPWASTLSEAQRAEVERTQAFLKQPIAGPINHNPELWQGEPQATGRYLFPQPMPQIPGWRIDLRPSEHLQLEPADSVMGQGLRMTGADIVSLFSDVVVEGGASYLVQASLASQASPDNRSRLELIWYDAEGKGLGSERVYQAPVDWTGEGEAHEVELFVPVEAPAQAARLRVRFSASRQYAGDFLEVRQVRVFLMGGS